MVLGAALALASAEAFAEDKVHAVPVLRVALGPAIHVAPPVEENVQLAVDLNAGVSMLFPTRSRSYIGIVVNPEAGYSFDGIGLHAFNLTCGVGYGHALAAITYHPRLLAGTLNDQFAIGMRNGLALKLFVDMMSLEIGHQFVKDPNGTLHHSVNIMGGVNPAAFVYLLATGFTRS